jgi:hypothetical protein
VKNVPRLLLALAAFASTFVPQTTTAQRPAAEVGQRAGGDAQKSRQAGPPDESGALLERVRGRVREYHARLFSVSFTEVVTQQALDSKMSPKGGPREYVFESVVARRARPGAGEETLPVVTRKLTRRDGKIVGEKERAGWEEARRRERRKCGDREPADLYGDPLLFLLPENSAGHTFTREADADFEGRRVAVLAAEPPPAAEPVRLTFEGNCFRLSRGLRRRARVLVDPATYDVLQVRWELAETFAAETGNRVVRKGIFFRFAPSRELSYERSDTTISFRPVRFRDPEQTLWLPVSSEHLRLTRGARDAGFRTAQTYSNYRRFLTSVEVKDTDGDPR